MGNLEKGHDNSRLFLLEPNYGLFYNNKGNRYLNTITINRC